MRRPAETVGLAGAVTLIASAVLGVDDPTALVAIGVAASSAPAAVTLLVRQGGVRGVARLLWRGRSAPDVAVVESRRKRS